MKVLYHLRKFYPTWKDKLKGLQNSIGSLKTFKEGSCFNSVDKLFHIFGPR